MDSLGYFFGGKNMCGVTGAFGNNISKMEDQFRKATLRLSHRGPDFQKYNLINESLLLGHTRLSILDLDARANQPMSDKKGNTLVFNGEIYNFKELRDELKKKYNFKTNLDTEVLIPGYREWGDELWNKLNGMFSIVLWDKKNKNLTMVRDHVGIKPLHYYMCGERLYFASDYNSFFHQNFEKIKLN